MRLGPYDSSVRKCSVFFMCFTMVFTWWSCSPSFFRFFCGFLKMFLRSFFLHLLHSEKVVFLSKQLSAALWPRWRFVGKYISYACAWSCSLCSSVWRLQMLFLIIDSASDRHFFPHCCAIIYRHNIKFAVVFIGIKTWHSCGIFLIFWWCDFIVFFLWVLLLAWWEHAYGVFRSIECEYGSHSS